MKNEKKIPEKGKELNDQELASVNGGFKLPKKHARNSSVDGKAPLGKPGAAVTLAGGVTGVVSGGVSEDCTGDDGQGEKNEIHLPVMPIVY